MTVSPATLPSSEQMAVMVEFICMMVLAMIVIGQQIYYTHELSKRPLPKPPRKPRAKKPPTGSN